MATTADHRKCTGNSITGAHNQGVPGAFWRQVGLGQSLGDFLLLDTMGRLVDAYLPKFSTKTGASTKPILLEFGVLFIKQGLGLTDKETVEKIQEKA